MTAVEPPDLAIVKTHAASPWPVGSEQSWTLTVRNVGGSATTGTTTVTDSLPAGAIPVAASGPGWTCSVAGQTVTCRTSAALAPGATSAILVRVRITTAAASTLVNVARVATPDDGNPANDTDRDDVPVTRPAAPPAGSGGGATTSPTAPRVPGTTTTGGATSAPAGSPRTTTRSSPLSPRGLPPGVTAPLQPGISGPLPYTGLPTDAAVLWAAVLVGLGTAMVVASTRQPQAAPAVRPRPRTCLAHGGE